MSTEATPRPASATAAPLRFADDPEAPFLPTLPDDTPWANPSPLLLRFAPRIVLDDDLFAELSAANPELRLERTVSGDLEIMYPAGGESSWQNSLLTARLVNWNDGLGEDQGRCFDSSIGFRLPSGATKGPDASWIARERWEALPPEQRRGFPPICPDFVAELRSPSDSKAKLREKMKHLMSNGARLGWLIDPKETSVEIYRAGRPVERLERPERLDGEDILPGFVLELRGILFE